MRRPSAGSAPAVTLTRRDVFLLIALLDELNAHLEAALDSMVIPGHPWPAIRERRLRRRSEDVLMDLCNAAYVEDADGRA